MSGFEITGGVGPATVTPSGGAELIGTVTATDSPSDGGFVLIDGYPIDLTLSESHKFDSEVTEFPVEQGADITDNIRPKPLEVTMEGIISDTPLDPTLISQRGGGPFTPTTFSQQLITNDAYRRLLKIRNARQPVNIMTSLAYFKSMALKSLTIPRTAGQPHVLRFTATFVQIQIVTSNVAQRTSIPRVSSTVPKSSAPSATLTTDLGSTTGDDSDSLTRQLGRSAPGALITNLGSIANTGVLGPITGAIFGGD
jgi:hypothetical protein